MTMTLEDQIIDVITDPPDGIVVLPRYHSDDFTSRAFTWNDIEDAYRHHDLIELFNTTHSLGRSRHNESPTGMATLHREDTGFSAKAWRCVDSHDAHIRLKRWEVEYDPSITF